MVYIRSVEKPDNHSVMQLVLMTLKVLFKAHNYTTLRMTNKILLFLCRISHEIDYNLWDDGFKGMRMTFMQYYT